MILNILTEFLANNLKGYEESNQTIPVHQIIQLSAAFYFLIAQVPALAHAYRAQHDTTYNYKQRYLSARESTISHSWIS